jgi:pectinesterase
MVVVGVSIGIPLAVKKSKETRNDVKQGAVNAACQATSYPAMCNETLSGGNYTADSKGITRMSLTSAGSGVNSTLEYVLLLNGTSPNVTAAVEVCVEVLGMSQEQIDAAVAELESSNATTRQQAMDDIKAWVSGAMELHTTCVDAFLEVSLADGQTLQQQANRTDQLFSNALAFVNAMAAYGDDVLQWKPMGFSLPSGVDLSDLSGLRIPQIPGFGNRRLLSSRSDWVSESESALPGWMDAQTQRHLLQTPSYDVVVAQDGTGSFKTIQAAVDAHKVNTQRFVIYVKAGTYNEQVIVPKKAKFLTIVGDGDLTVITGNRNVALMQGMTTFKSATLSEQPSKLHPLEFLNSVNIASLVRSARGRWILIVFWFCSCSRGRVYRQLVPSAEHCGS